MEFEKLGDLASVIIGLVIVSIILFAFIFPISPPIALSIFVSFILYTIGVGLKTFGREIEGIGVEKIAVASMVGILVGVQIMILHESFAEFVGNWMLLIDVIYFFAIFFFWRTSGSFAVYSITPAFILLGYLMTGPYSGYVRSAISQISGPIQVGVEMAKEQLEELWLMATNPMEYIRRQQLKQVKPEQPLSYPKGVELKRVVAQPDGVRDNQDFYILVRAQNEGDLEARNIVLHGECESRCSKTDETKSEVRLAGLEKSGVLIESLGPFRANAEKLQDVGRKASVSLELSYEYNASSSLLVTVMRREEIERRIKEGGKLFESVVAVGKATPAMIAMSVGEQPLYENKTYALVVSIVKKHPYSEKIVIEAGRKLFISLSPEIGSGLRCISRVFECTSNDDYSVNCTVIAEDGIELKKDNPFEPLTCTFRTASISGPSKSGLIRARLESYKVVLKQDVGPTIISFECPSDEVCMPKEECQEQGGSLGEACGAGMYCCRIGGGEEESVTREETSGGEEKGVAENCPGICTSRSECERLYKRYCDPNYVCEAAECCCISIIG